ncbi:hypothetical protein PI124_g16576 [Phytophthora idaei]|nr:hypothetical protein PI125_g18968 [Phytophthora idaei]KAG3238466.1 hypothetical protein PI124_g16576 [Phytophthora idaei]
MQSRGSLRHQLGQILQSIRNPDLVRSKGYVNGEWVEGRGGEYFAAVDPVSDEVLSQVACMGKDETQEAIAAAYVAQHRWKKISPPSRSVPLEFPLRDGGAKFSALCGIWLCCSSEAFQ